MIAKIDHVVITTANLSECIAFYQALGFQTQDAGGRWEFLSGDFKINVHRKGHELIPKAKHVQVGSADLCFELDCSLAQCQKTLIENGISGEQEIVVRHGVRGIMHSLYLRDPDGNLIELCSYE